MEPVNSTTVRVYSLRGSKIFEVDGRDESFHLLRFSHTIQIDPEALNDYVLWTHTQNTERNYVVHSESFTENATVYSEWKDRVEIADVHLNRLMFAGFLRGQGRQVQFEPWFGRQINCDVNQSFLSDLERILLGPWKIRHCKGGLWFHAREESDMARFRMIAE